MTRTVRRLLCAAGALLVFALPSGAQGPAPAAGRVVYDAAFYASFAPRTALDMIRQTPGFVLDAGEESAERRGFAGAVGNVLIDGQRLSAKSQSLEDVLGRVAATDVLRIEILRGSEVAGDASNATVLANVIRTPTSGSGTWELGAEVTNEREPTPTGSFGWSGRNEGTEYSVGGNLYGHRHNSPGVRAVTDGTGAPVAERRNTYLHENDDYVLNGQAAFPAGDGRLVVTGQVKQVDYAEAWTQRTTDPDGLQVENIVAPYDQKDTIGEAGVTWQQAMAGWDTELIALVTRKRLRAHTISTEYDGDDVRLAAFEQAIRQDSGESILRGTFARTAALGRLELGAEIAVNTLDGELDLTEDLGSGPLPVQIPNANVAVEESRAETFASIARGFGADWSFDARLAAEFSRLEFTGDTEQSVSLSYLKPRVQLTRKLGRHQVQMRIFREVGQLDFTDFVSTAQFADGTINGGNPDLEPQTAWALELDADLRFTDDAALRVRAFRHWLQDVVDFVPVGPPGAQFDARGNLGEGSLLGAEVSLRVPLKALLPGGTFSVAGTWQESTVRDPLTARKRIISDFPENSITVDLRQDLNDARLAWGLHYEGRSRDFDYRLGEIDSFRELHMLQAFVETTYFDGIKVALTAYNVLSDTEERERRFFAPDRGGVLLLREDSRFRPGTWWLLKVSADF